MFKPSADDIESYIKLPNLMLGDIKSPVIWKAAGNGMIGAGILSGDWLICDLDRQAKDGDIVIAKVNGEMMCRRIFFEEEGIRFRREDGKTPDTITTDCEILAVYSGLIRSSEEH